MKSVLGEFSSGVSICCKKVLSQIWKSVYQDRPARGMGGSSSGSACITPPPLNKNIFLVF